MRVLKLSIKLKKYIKKNIENIECFVVTFIMNDYSSCLISTKMPSVTTVVELNNNSEHVLDGIYRPRSESRASTISSASSSNETSEEMELPDLSEESENKQDNNTNETPDKPRFRSMSDGSPALPVSDEPFEIFPSLPDSVLEKMGLIGDSPKDRLSEEESEQKFVALALAFSIDATTIKERCQRQRRYRDQTEKNLTVEIDRLIKKVYRLQPLCVDAETTEMVTDLLTQVDIAMKAAAFAAFSSERYGAVQHEERLSQSVELMIKHVTLLKQQRDSARKHLQYTKRMLQNTNNLNETQTLPNPKTKNTHSRRASIAIISQQPLKTAVEPKNRITRRTSELSIRASALPRIVRPSRLELGVDLGKIKEGATEEITSTTLKENTLDDQNQTYKDEPPNIEKENTVDTSKFTFRQKMSYKLKEISGKTTSLYNNWCDNGSIQEICLVFTFLCFSLSIIILGNILLEFEYAKYNMNDCDSWNFENIVTNIFPHTRDSCNQKERTIS